MITKKLYDYITHEWKHNVTTAVIGYKDIATKQTFPSKNAWLLNYFDITEKQYQEASVEYFKLK